MKSFLKVAACTSWKFGNSREIEHFGEGGKDLHAYLGESSGDGAQEERGEGHDGGHRGHQGGRQVVSLGGFFSSILRYANRVTDTEGESTPTPPLKKYYPTPYFVHLGPKGSQMVKNLG